MWISAASFASFLCFAFVCCQDLQEVMSLLGRVSQLALSAGDEGVLDTSAGTRTPNAQDVGL